MLRRSVRAVLAAVSIASVLVPALAARGQAPSVEAPPARSPLTIEAALDASIQGPAPFPLGWHPDGKTFTFLRPAGDHYDVVGLDTRSGAERVLVASARLSLPRGSLPYHPLRHATWLSDGRHLLVPAGDDVYLVDTETSQTRALVSTPEREEIPVASPDGRLVAFARDGDLWVVDVRTGREARLTRTGSETLLNGRLDWVYEEELGGRRGHAFAWSPDSRQVAFLELDQSKVQTFPLVDFEPAAGRVEWQRYPTPGTPNATVRLGVVTLAKDGSPAAVRFAPAPPADGYIAPQLAFTPDSRHVAYQEIPRAQNALDLRLVEIPKSVDRPLGPPRTLARETSSSWVNLLAPPLFHDGGRRFVWLSERDGFAHAWDCSVGEECRQVTRGRWMVDARVSFSSSGAGQPLVLDERSQFLYFRATEKDARERHLYRVRLDGSGFARLTEEEGTHETVVSPDGRHYADFWSDERTPPRAWLSSQDGTKRWWIEKNEAPPVLGYAAGELEWVDLMADDGTTLHAWLLRPDDFDPSRRYPVVVSVYGGPHAQRVTRSWKTADPLDRVLAGHGFLVWQLDNRGSAGRGLAFEAVVSRNLGRTELRDQLAGVAHLKSLPYVDPDRIGITGWSYGGYMTLYALTHAPGTFRAGAAGAPVVDWTRYDTIYTERYMSTPEQNPEGYEESSPLRAASRLTGEVLLIHGTADDNVHFSNSVAFAGALVAAGRPYSLVVHPGQKHSFRPMADRVARDRAILAFFERTLKPPATP